MAEYNVLDARNHLSRLIAAAEAGDEVTIMRRGKAVARIVAIDDAPRHTGVDFAAWLEANPLPSRTARLHRELDELITENRDAWA